MKIYVAGSSQHIPLIRSWQQAIVQSGHTITEDWTKEFDLPPDQVPSPADCARRDLSGIDAADAVVFIGTETASAGAWFELGYAWQNHKFIFAILDEKAFEERSQLIFLHLPNVQILREHEFIHWLMHGNLVQPLILQEFLGQQMDWSLKTFGSGDRRKGLMEHLRSELAEVEAAPDGSPEYLGELVDVLFLALDGMWRAGYGPDQIATAMREKQARNFARKWPPPPPPDRASYHLKDGAEVALADPA